MPLTDMWLRSQLGKAQTKRVEKADGGGLGVRITPKGRIHFQLRFRINKKESRIYLDEYPSVFIKTSKIRVD